MCVYPYKVRLKATIQLIPAGKGRTDGGAVVAIVQKKNQGI